MRWCGWWVRAPLKVRQKRFALSMTLLMQMNRTRSRVLFIGLAAWVGLASLASCVSSDDAPAGARVEHPDPGAKAPPPPTRLASSPASTQAASIPSAHPSSSSDVEDPPSGFTRASIDKAIAEDKPSRPWSKSVPERRCTKDDECGDGFCDRGRCAAIWTYRERYGQRCEEDERCAGHLCIDGRCRSCASDEECTRTESWQSDPKCESSDDIPNARECYGVVGSGHRGIIVPGKNPGNNVAGPK
jgi:hypothetical protein